MVDRHEKRRDTVSIIHFLTLKYYGTFTYIKQYIYWNTHLNQIKGIFSDKPCMIVEISNSKFVDILNAQETCLRKVLNFSHVWQ